MAISILPGLIEGLQPSGMAFPFPQVGPSVVGAASAFPRAAYAGSLTPGALPTLGGAGGSAALPYADVAATGGRSLLGGLASRVPGIGGFPTVAAGEGYAAPLAGLGARLGTGVASKAVVPAIGIGGDMLLDRASKAVFGKGHNSVWSDIGEGAGGGALAGGAAGALALPIPVVGEVTTAGGAALGAVVGGVAGLIGHLLGGKKKPKGGDPTQVITDAIAQSGIDPSRAAELQTYYNVLTKLGGGDDKAKASALQQVGTMLINEMQQGKQQQLDSNYLASVQAQTAQFVRPFADQAVRNAGQYAKSLESMLPGLPTAYQNVLRAGITDQLGASLQLANAYAAQAQMAPAAYGQLQQQNQLNQVAQQVLAQGIGSALSGGGAGGGSLTSQLQGYQPSS